MRNCTWIARSQNHSRLHLSTSKGQNPSQLIIDSNPKGSSMALMAKLGPFQLLNFHPKHNSQAYLPPICPKFADFRPRKFNFCMKPSKFALPVSVIRAQSFQVDFAPDTKFYKVEAILRPWRVPKVSSALLRIGIRGVTVSDVRGFGAQGGVAERHAGSEFLEDKFVSKVKMEVVVSKDQVESVIDAIITEARTGEIGDGKIFVIPVADIIRVRTGERGEQAERMSGGRHEMISNGPSS